MKLTTVHLTIPASAQVFVHKDQKLSADTKIAEYSANNSFQIIPVADMLKINPIQIAKYMKKGVGEYIEAGHVLVEKKGLFSSSILKSPYSGKISEIDLKIGTLTIAVQSQMKDHILSTPFAAKVKDMDKKEIVLEVEAVQFEAQEGDGDDVVGQLHAILADKTDALQISDDDIDESIMACNCFTHDALAKIDVLGCKGVVFSEAVSVDISIPWLQIDVSDMKHILQYNGSKVWILPSEKKIYVQA